MAVASHAPSPAATTAMGMADFRVDLSRKPPLA